MKKLYLLLGQENFDKNEYLKNLKLSILKNTCEEEVSLSCEENKGSILLNLLENRSLFSSTRLIIAQEAEKITSSLIKTLIKAYNNSQDILILMSEENKLLPWENSKEISCEKKVFYPLSEIDKKGFLSRLAQQYKKKLSPQAIDFFIIMAGDDKTTLERMASLILPKLPDNKLIEEKELSDFLSHSRTETPYSLFHAFLEGNLPLCLLRLENLLQSKTEAIGLLSLFLWQIRRLFSLAKLGGTYNSFSEMKIFRQEKPLFEKALRLYKVDEIEKMVVRVIHYDLLLREERSDQHKHLLQIMLYELIIKKGEPLEEVKENLPLF